MPWYRTQAEDADNASAVAVAWSGLLGDLKKVVSVLDHNTAAAGQLNLVAHPALLDVIEQIVGPDITLSPNGHARYKLPSSGAGSITPWHRDAMTHVRASDPVQVITCWIPTSDVDSVNGCLVAVPGGHRAYSQLSWPLTPEVIAELDQNAVSLPTRKGDVVLLDKDLPHASTPNRSDSLRWSFDLRYYPTGEPGDRPWFPSLEVRRRGLSSLTHDVTAWRREWESARDHFALTGTLVPGRPEYARAVAERQIQQWIEAYDA